MENALCIEDGAVYTAISFANQLTNDFDRKRRLLQCPECGGPAFFRNASHNGRAPCFGARPHIDGCQLAAQDYVKGKGDDGDDQDAPITPGSKIIVDFQYGALTQSEIFYGQSRMTNIAAYNAGTQVGDEFQPGVFTHRRPRSLLRMLIESPAFGNSGQTIKINGRGEYCVRDFFVPLKFASYHFSGHFKGYWGLISYAKLASDKSLWFNSGGNDNINFCLDAQYVDVIIQRYGIKDLEDLAGAYILVLGAPRVSQNGKLFCMIDVPEYMPQTYISATRQAQKL